MSKTDKQGLTTTIVHRDRRAGMEYGALRAPLHNSVQYGLESVEDLIGIFRAAKRVVSTMRARTPTTAMLEAKINEIEGGWARYALPPAWARLPPSS
jgi:cystathionine gamma-synthase/O-acetylhomoserine (thiol)-lyase